ncbi:MAG TPA: hypothetical protein VK473_14700 [Terriglobales bacterium]|nr:hypothetical protein [Terriglobales bacterium]
MSAANRAALNKREPTEAKQLNPSAMSLQALMGYRLDRRVAAGEV